MARVRVFSPGRRRRALTAAGAVAGLVLAAAGVVAVTASAQADAANLVQNPGFESGSLSPWSCSSGSGAVVSSPTHAGSYALQATPAGNDYAQCSQTISVQPNSSYTLSAWTEGSYVYLGVSGTGTTDSSTWTSSSSWTQQSTSFTTAASTTSVTIWLHGWYGQGSYDADDVSLTGPGGGSSASASSGASNSPSPTPTMSASASASVSASPSGSSGGSGGDLLSNPGFESGSTSGWTCSSADMVVASPVHSGSYALAGTPGGSDYAQCSQTVSVQPNTTYAYSGYVDGSYVYLGGNGSNGDVNTWTAGTSGYQQLSVSITTGASQTSLTVYVHGWYGEPVFHADDFSLTGPGGSGGTPSSSPSTSPSASPSASPTGCTSNCGGTGKHLLTGYWQDFTNPARPRSGSSDVNSQYDIIAVAFANATGTPGADLLRGRLRPLQRARRLYRRAVQGGHRHQALAWQEGHPLGRRPERHHLGERLVLRGQLRQQRGVDHQELRLRRRRHRPGERRQRRRTWARPCTRWPARAVSARLRPDHGPADH